MFKKWIIGLIVLFGILTALDIYLYQVFAEAHDAYTASYRRYDCVDVRFGVVDCQTSYDADLGLLRDQAEENFELARIATLGAFGLLLIALIALIARSIKQGRLVVLKSFPKVIFGKLKSLPKVIFSKQHFEGMTFFKWGVLIIGLIFALSFLEFVRNVTG